MVFILNLIASIFEVFGLNINLEQDENLEFISFYRYFSVTNKNFNGLFLKLKRFNIGGP